MPKLSDHQSNEFTKLLLSGDSGSGKSGALASLVAADYKLRILDLDNGLEPLKTYILKECPTKIDNVEFHTLRDDYEGGPTGPIVKSPKAFINAVKMLDKWKYDDVDLGDPAKWGPECILVIDSSTFLGDAAFNWAVALNPGAKDPRQWYHTAQQGIEKVFAGVTAESFKTNVIIISHLRYEQSPDGKQKGYPTTIGGALGPTIPRYFNNWAQVETKKGERTIRTAITSTVDLKNTKPFDMQDTYPISTGLAEFFAVLRNKTVEKPTKVTLVRKA